MTAFPPTPEQSAILDAFRTGSNLVIQAGAGTGKTTTIELLASDMAQRGVVGIYITLNKSVAADVGSRFIYGNVSSSTIHSLAYHLGYSDPRIAPLMNKLNAENPVSRMNVARHLGVEKVVTYTTFRESNRQAVGLPSRTTTASSLQLCHAALDALKIWCQTDEDELTTDHVIQPVTMPDDQFAERYAPVVAEIAVHAWTSDILSPGGRLPFTHDYYLKLVSLARPSFTAQLGAPAGSVIFFDEAQDSRPCVSQMLHGQTDMQLVTVGDSAQAIYGSFTGARDALPKFSAQSGATTLPLTTSWRFGPGIADAANGTLAALDAPIRLSGNPDPNLADSTVVEVADPDNVPPTVDAVLVRSNSRLIIEAERQIASGRKVHIATDVWALLNIIRDFQRIESGNGKPTSPELREFTGGLPQILDYVHDTTVDTGSPTKALLARFIEEGVEPTEDVISASVTEADADVVVSTIHKSKGRQWNQVYLAVDPEEIVPGINPRLRIVHVPGTNDMTTDSRESLMLYYVALTRGRHTVYVPRATTTALANLYADHDKRSTSDTQLLPGG